MRFQLLAELGRGGAGIVYKAIDLETGDTVALKQLFPGTRAPAPREVRLARKVTHPNVCRVYDLHKEDGHVYISMEYVDGGPLQGPLPPADALPIGKQICSAVHEVHRQGLLHRDIKPGNILLTRDGTSKLADFGLVQSTDPQATTDGAIGGTPEYMAPEVKKGAKPDVRSDIYSLGLVLKYLGIKGPAVSRCLEEDPAKRFASAAEVGEALDSPVAAVVQPVPKFPHRILVAGVAAVVIVAVMFLGSASHDRVPAVPPSPQASPVPAKPSVAVLFNPDDLTPVLAQTGDFRVVERRELDKVLAELKLNRNEAFDPATTQRVGRLVGARYLLFGERRSDKDGPSISARMVHTETGVIDAYETVKDGEFTDLAARLAKRIQEIAPNK